MEKTIVFYDGDCIVCDLEMSHYKKQEKLGLLKFVDIHSEEFKQYQHLLTFDVANERMHILKEGKKQDGVDAFLVIWSVLPQKRYKILSKIINHKYVRPLADIGYNIFAKYRKYLPKKHWFQ
jgi:predicted DCC family thiol-disulfide oxidoreductase YuxK